MAEEHLTHCAAVCGMRRATYHCPSWVSGALPGARTKAITLTAMRSVIVTFGRVGAVRITRIV